MENVLQAGFPHMIFTDKLSSHELHTRIFILDLNILHYLAMHEIIHTAED